MTLEKHLYSVSRAASQRLGIFRNSWRVFHDRLLLGICFPGFVPPVLEYCSAVWCSAADIHHKLIDRVVSGAGFLTGSFFECDFAHRRSEVVSWMLYKIRYNHRHSLYGALPVPYVPMLVTCGVLVTHLYTYAPPQCRTWYYCRTFIPSVEWKSCSNVSVEWCFTIVLGERLCRTGELQEQSQCFFIGLSW